MGKKSYNNKYFPSFAVVSSGFLVTGDKQKKIPFIASDNIWRKYVPKWLNKEIKFEYVQINKIIILHHDYLIQPDVLPSKLDVPKH